ncbi:beta-ketoacyl synthase N-terminal-like domain-containing protein [Jidongwangia harbinensis]|uniref:beta-ketoacyl synthase N-terminal-like domain-containing protein n=1 Tax=Jidongwangia harbinensis TaxID=2878561 RepID=UPI001CD9E8AF|nr:beta-ketoacyl synthase N-terminal-like domain-containing protein [Jidongwangia harbinensis]MCA2218259.1 hypothetical protein [Jidongwangia harbinensis]
MNDVTVTGIGVLLPGIDKPAHALHPSPPAGPGWFDVTTVLPGRGYRRLPPASQYLLAAAAEALADAGPGFAAAPADRRGVVTALNNAGAELMDQQDRTIIATGADDLSPLTTPYFATSLFGSRLAAEHTVHGFSLTVNSPRTAGLEGVQLGGRALAAGRADVLLIGATEQTLPPGEPGAADSDVGAVVLVGETGAAARARAHGGVRVRTGFLGPWTGDEALDRLWDSTVAAGPVPPVEAVLDDSPAGAWVAGWLRTRGLDPVLVPAPAGCLTPLRRVAGHLAAGRADQLVVTAAAEGCVAFARITPPDHPEQE